jgi:hypothetical protein
VTVSNPAVVDFVSHDPVTDEVILSMVEERQWGAEGELLLDLQAKLNTYLTYIESGQLLEDYPDVAGKKIVFRLHYMVEIGPREREFIRTVCQSHLFPTGIGWQHSKLSADLSSIAN